MNLITREIVRIGKDEGISLARIPFANAHATVHLPLLPGAFVRDVVLVESGVAIPRLHCCPSEGN